MAKTIHAFVSTGAENTQQTHQFVQGSGDQGKPTRIKAVKGARYQLKDPAANNAGPEYIRSKRVGKDLCVSLYGSQEADLIIEGYYEAGYLAPNSTGLYGMTESGQVYEYIPETPATAGLAANLTDGARPTSQVLGGAPIEGAFELSALALAAGATSHSGMLVAAAAASAVVATADTDNNSNELPKGQTGHLDHSTDTGTLGDNFTRHNAPKISGKAAPNSTVEVLVHGETYRTVSDADGHYVIAIPLTNALPDGKYIPIIKVTNAAGSSTSEGTEFEVDSSTNGTAQLTHTPSNDTGDSATDGITGNNKPSFSGTGEPGADVAVSIAGKVLRAVVDANGNWITEPYTDAIADGTYTATAIFTDKAGNTKEADAGTVVINTNPNANASLSIGSIDDGASNTSSTNGSKDTGSSSTDFITQDNTLVFQGMVNSFTANGDKVRLQVVSADNTVVIEQDVDVIDNVWRFDNQRNTALRDGSYTIKASIVDTTGTVVVSASDQALVIDSKVVNTAPVNQGVQALSTNEDTNVAITGLSIADSTNVGDNYTVKLTVTNGTLNVSGGDASIADNGTSIVTLTGSKAAINATLAANVSFSPDSNFNGSAQLTMFTSDGSFGDEKSIESNQTLTVIAVNDAPVATNDEVTALEAGGSNNGAVADNSNPTGNVLENDTDPEGAALSIKTIVKGTTGTSANVVTNTTSTSANATSVNGDFGTLKIGADGSYVYTVNNSNSSVQELNEGDTLTDVFTYTVKDAEGATTSATISVTVNGANDAPVLANPIGDTTATEGSALRYVLPSNAFTDVDSSLTLSAVVVDADGNPLSTQPDWFQFDASTRTVSGTPPVGSAGTVHVKVTASDGSLDLSDVFDVAVEQAAQTNHAPVVTPSATARSYTENGTALVANNTLTLSDEDSANLTSATVQITSGLSTGDVLAFNNTAKITSAFDESTGLLTLTGTATKAEYQAALQAVTFSSSSENPTATSASRTLTWQVDDGQSANHASNSATSTIHITAVNDVPVATNDEATALEAGGTNNGTVADNSNPTGNVLENDSDPEGAALSVKTIAKGITGTSANVVTNTTSTSTNATSVNGDFGTLKIGADGSYVYTVNNSNSSVQELNEGDTLTDVFTYTVNDAGGATTSATISVTVNGANDAPVLANPIGDTTATEGSALSYVLPSNAFTDVDSSLTLSAVVVDADGNPLSQQPDWFQFDASTRTVSGTPPVGSAGTVHVKVTASDGSLDLSDVFDIDVRQINYAPVPTATSLTNVFTTGLTTTVAITDNQTASNTANGGIVTYTLQFSDAINSTTLTAADFSVTNGSLVANSLQQVDATTWTVQAKAPTTGLNFMSLTLNNNSYKSLNAKDGLGVTSSHAFGTGSVSVDTSGSTSTDKLIGSTADETFNIASGATTTASGNDTVYAGGGDDKVFFNSFNLSGMDVDGGSGVNTLFVGGASDTVTMDLTNTAVMARVQNFSGINITGRTSTNNILKLDWDAISRLSGTVDNPATYGVDESKLLVITGDVGDEVQITNFAAWSQGTLRSAATLSAELGSSYNFLTGHTYTGFTLAGVTIYIDDNITTSSLAASTSGYRPRSYAMTVQDLFGSSFTDSDAGQTFKGVAITSAGTTAEIAARGSYQYSTDQGTTWTDLAANLTDTNAKFLAPTALVRFLGLTGVPTVNPNNLVGRLVDSSGENNSASLVTGNTVNVSTNGGRSAYSSNAITISILNRAPVVNDANGLLPYDPMGTSLIDGNTNPASIDNMFRSVFSDPDLHSFQGVFITGKGDTSLGKYQYSTTGIGTDAVWKNFAALSDATAVYLGKTDYLRFVPAASNTSVTKPQLTARLADRTAAVAGFVAGDTYDVSGVNHGGSTAVSADAITVVAPANTVGIAEAVADATTVTTGQTLMSSTPTLSGSIGQLLKTGEVVEIWRDDTLVGNATISVGSSSWTYADSGVSTATHSYVAKYKASSTGSILATSSTFSLVVAATPLVLDLNGDGVQTTGFTETVLFDLLATGTKQNVGWVSKQDGLLAIDLNGDGQINSGVELFGSSTVLADGTHAKDGWVALAALDSDANGNLDAHDAQFNQLRVWIDANGNGQTDAQELLTLAEHHIASISLTPDGRSIQQNGNVIQGYSTFTNTDGSKHEVADVGLQVHDANVASIDLSVVDHAAAHLDKAHESAYVDLGELLALDNAVSDSAQHYQVYSDAGMNGVQQLIDQTMISVHHVS